MKAQTYTLDLVIALALIITAVTFSANIAFAPHTPSVVHEDAQSLSQILFSPYPKDWTQDTVILPGIVYEGIISASQLLEFSSLDQEKLQFLAGLSSNVSIYITNETDLVWEYYPLALLEQKEISRRIRFAVLNEQPVKIEVITWRK